MARRAKNKGKSATPSSSSACNPPFSSSDSSTSTEQSPSSSKQSASSSSSYWPPPSLSPTLTPELRILSSKNIEDLSKDEAEERNMIFAQHDRLWQAYVDKVEGYGWPDMSSVSDEERTRWISKISNDQDKVSEKEWKAFRKWEHNLSLREGILYRLGPEIDDDEYH